MIMYILLSATALLNRALLVTAGSCKDEAVANSIDVLFSKDGNILYLDEWNSNGSSYKFKLVMAHQATLYCSEKPADCSLTGYNETTHPFELSNVVIDGNSPSFANGYVKVKYYIKLTGIETVFEGSKPIHLLRKSTLKSLTKDSVSELNSTLGFTTAFVDGDLTTKEIDNSLDKIIIPIAVVIFLILLLIVYGLLKTHDEVAELKRKSGYGSRTRVSPGIELQKVEKKQTQKVHYPTSGNYSVSDIASCDLNPQSKYNDTNYGHQGHVPRIELPHGPTPYAFPRRSFRGQGMVDETPPATDEETPPPGYEDCIPARKMEEQEEAVTKQVKALIEPSLLDSARKLPPLQPLVSIANKNQVTEEPSTSNIIEKQPITNITQPILNKEKDSNQPTLAESCRNPDEVISSGNTTALAVAEDNPPIENQSLHTNGISDFPANVVNSPKTEKRKSGKKKHKKHKHKHKHKNRENSGEENEQDVEGEKKRKHHKKKKKHRHKQSDDDADDNEKEPDII